MKAQNSSSSSAEEVFSHLDLVSSQEKIIYVPNILHILMHRFGASQVQAYAMMQNWLMYACEKGSMSGKTISTGDNACGVEYD